ncbi:hypothetical protein IFM89_009175 [Coptis chinensis]|uniref:Uncharacterized protein n=1 Tax=Coptis chinensis TaxID=261450 RepID=A0A835IX71_9MAGN|nr:hypothetical protein IFM89_009175 [Coptis chinensis]
MEPKIIHGEEVNILTSTLTKSSLRNNEYQKLGSYALIGTYQTRFGEDKTGDVVTVKEYKLKPIDDAGPVIDAGGIFSYARKTGMIPSAASS